MNKLLDTKEAASKIGIAHGTLENWRTKGRGPKFIKTCTLRRGKVLYDERDIEAWIDENRHVETIKLIT